MLDYVRINKSKMINMATSPEGIFFVCLFFVIVLSVINDAYRENLY